MSPSPGREIRNYFHFIIQLYIQNKLLHWIYRTNINYFSQTERPSMWEHVGIIGQKFELKKSTDSCRWTLSVPQNSQFFSGASLLENYSPFRTDNVRGQLYVHRVRVFPVPHRAL